MRILIFLLIWTTVAFSQGLVGRNNIINPFKTEAPSGLLPRTLYSAEANRGYGSVDQEHYWNLKFNAVIEFYRWSTSTLVLVGSNEMTANPYSQIKFNPRSSNWNERIMFFKKHGDVTSEWGITHQCKHDIDNHGNARRGDTTGVSGGNRVIVLTSVHGGVTAPFNFMQNKLNLLSSVRLHHYILAVDYNEPDSIELESNWGEITQSLMAQLRVTYEWYPDITVYSNDWINPVLFEAGESIKTNYHIETGVSFVGFTSDLDLYYAYETYFDDVMNPWSQKSQSHYFGIRVRSSLL